MQKYIFIAVLFFLPVITNAQYLSNVPASGTDTLPTVSSPQNEDIRSIVIPEELLLTELRIPSRNTDRCTYQLSIVDSSGATTTTATPSQLSSVSSYSTDTTNWNIYTFSSVTLLPDTYEIRLVGTSCPFTGGTRGYSHYYSGAPNGTDLYIENGIAGQAIYELYAQTPPVPVTPIIPFPIVENLASTTCLQTASGTSCEFHYTTSTTTVPLEFATVQNIFYFFMFFFSIMLLFTLLTYRML